MKILGWLRDKINKMVRYVFLLMFIENRIFEYYNFMNILFRICFIVNLRIG